MELFFKQYLPIFFIFHAIWYWKRNKNLNFWGILLFYSYYMLASNYAFEIYRAIHQTILCIFFIYNLFHIKKIPKNILKFIICFFVAILISSLFNSIVMESYIAMIINYIFNLSAVLLLCIKVRDNDELYSNLKYLRNIGWMLSVFAIITFIIEPTRIELVSSNPNYLSFALGVSFVTSLFIKREILISIIILLGIFVTASRSILLICTLIFLITQFKFYKAKILLFAPVFLLLFLIVIDTENVTTPNIIENTILNRFKNVDDNESLLIRYEIYDVAKKIITNHPVNGMGYGQFQYNFGKYLSNTSFFLLKTDEIVTHNDYIRIATELGIIGTLAFLIILIYTFQKTIKLHKPYKELCLFLLAMTLFFSVSHNNLNSFMFWFILLLPVIIYKLQISNNEYKAST
jgi:O-antigen ligase